MSQNVLDMTPDQLRMWFRRHSLRSLYFFCKVVLGFKDMTATLHKDVCSFLQRPIPNKLVELPRGHLKTSICTIAYAMWRIAHDCNIRILLANATATNASHFLRMIAGTFESNELFRWIFSDLIPDFNKVKWTDTEIEVRRTKSFPESTVESIGVGGTVSSRHYNLLIKDDLVDLTDVPPASIDAVLKKVLDWHRYSVSLAVNPASLEQVIVGTRWSFNDLISFVKDHESYFSLYSRAVVDEGKPIWPERFTPEVVDKILELQGPHIFSCQYMNNPVHEDQRAFDLTQIRRFRSLPHIPLRHVMAVDPAISQGRGDYSGLVVVGMNPDYDKYVVDARRGRWGVDELIDNIFELWYTWRPAAVGLESVLFQRALMWPIREAMRRERVSFYVQELRPSTRITKEARISSLHEYIANGSLWIREGLMDLEKEIQEFPFGAHDDLLDALAYAVQMCHPASKEATVNNDPFLLENILAELRKKQGTESKRIWTWHNVVPTQSEEVWTRV